jgi:hypothetical protein
MRLKCELYATEQNEIVNKIINILDLEHKNTYTLYELDNNRNIQEQIMTLIPEIRKYYSCNGIKAVREPDRLKRPWLSIIKHLLKPIYNVNNNKYRMKIEGKEIQTMQYVFTLHLT